MCGLGVRLRFDHTWHLEDAPGGYPSVKMTSGVGGVHDGDPDHTVAP